MNLKPYEAIIIGSGATGGIAALTLAKAGIRVLVIERGTEFTLAKAIGCPGLNQMESLKHWEKQRVRFGNAAFSWGQDLGSYISSEVDKPPRSNKANFFRRPEVLIAQNASNNPEKYLINYYD